MLKEIVIQSHSSTFEFFLLAHIMQNTARKQNKSTYFLKLLSNPSRWEVGYQNSKGHIVPNGIAQVLTDPRKWLFNIEKSLLTGWKLADILV